MENLMIWAGLALAIVSGILWLMWTQSGRASVALERAMRTAVAATAIVFILRVLAFGL